MAAAVQTELDLETPAGALSVGSVDLNNDFGEARIYNLRIRGRDGAYILKAEHVHLQVELDQLSLKKPNVAVVIPMVTVDGFELTLKWDELGRLNLVDIFKSRSFSLSTQPRKKSSFKLELNNIVLKNGTLRLIWPDFGFAFEGIETAGAVFYDKDELGIEVAKLNSPVGLAWIRAGNSKMHKRLDLVMPRNVFSKPASGRIEIPFTKTLIESFTWKAEGFSAAVSLSPTSGGIISAEGDLAFPKEGIEHNLKLTIEQPSPIVDRLTNNQIKGLGPLTLQSNGLDLAANFSLERLKLESLDLGAFGIKSLALNEFKYRGLNQSLQINVSLEMSEFRWRDLHAQKVGLQSKASLNWPAFNANRFWQQTLTSPISTLVQAVTGQSTVELANVSAANLKSPWGKIPTIGIKKLVVGTKHTQITGRLEGAHLGKSGRAKASLSSKSSLSLSGISGHLALNAVVTGRIQELLGQGFKHDQLQNTAAPNKETIIFLRAPITAPHKWRIERISQGGSQ